MRIAVYLPLLLSVIAPLGARPLSERCEPRLATWLLTTSALILGVATTVSLGLLAITGLIGVPFPSPTSATGRPAPRRSTTPPNRRSRSSPASCSAARC